MVLTVDSSFTFFKKHLEAVFRMALNFSVLWNATLSRITYVEKKLLQIASGGSWLFYYGIQKGLQGKQKVSPRWVAHSFNIANVELNAWATEGFCRMCNISVYIIRYLRYKARQVLKRHHKNNEWPPEENWLSFSLSIWERLGLRTYACYMNSRKMW